MLIPATSTEYLHIPVTAPVGVDLTATTVKIAVVAHRNNPSESEWQTAEWVEGVAKLLIGPDGGALDLDPGLYQVYIAIDPPGSENIVRLAGYLNVS